MLFNSFEFFLFFPIVTIIYFLLPHKFRWFHLLVASCIFYMAYIPVYIFILFFTIIIDYIAGILIENTQGRQRKWFLVLSIITNVGLLAFFKYYNFFIENINVLFHISHTNLNLKFLSIVLPIGLSFHTFQAMSYTIEVYRGNQKAERHFGIYALYVMFYPQLVAGPIERPQNMIHQFHRKNSFSYENAVNGFRQMLWGCLKKVVIADRLALTVDPVFNDPHHNSGIGLAIITIFFAFEIYCDFSGYSDIALGSAKIMGIDLMVNFNRPYIAKSISEFWKRWHISLSTWFYDYLFNPFVSALRNWGQLAIILGLLLTFFTSGLWHGAAWHYIVWGGIHGLALTYEALTRKRRKKIFKKIPTRLGNFISIFCTFSYVCFGYVYFRANNLKDAVFISKKIARIPSEIYQIIATRKIAFLNLPGLLNQIVPGFILIIIFQFVESQYVKYTPNNSFSKKNIIFRWAVYYTAIFILVRIGVYEQRQFIYFQF